MPDIINTHRLTADTRKSTLPGLLSLSVRWLAKRNPTMSDVNIGVNPAGDTGDVSPPKIGLRGTVMHYVPPIFSF